MLGAVAVVVAGVIAFAGVSALPRWWARRVGEQADGSRSTGIALGAMYGFVSLVLTVVVLVLVYRIAGGRWRWWLVGLALALVVAAPNLLTLWSGLGLTERARNADRIFEVQAPWFRTGTLLGALLGVAAAAFIWHMVASRRSARGEAERAREELRVSQGEQVPGPEQVPPAT